MEGFITGTIIILLHVNFHSMFTLVCKSQQFIRYTEILGLYMTHVAQYNNQSVANTKVHNELAVGPVVVPQLIK